jgi:hypothetical protein
MKGKGMSSDRRGMLASRTLDVASEIAEKLDLSGIDIDSHMVLVRLGNMKERIKVLGRYLIDLGMGADAIALGRQWASFDEEYDERFFTLRSWQPDDVIRQQFPSVYEGCPPEPRTDDEREAFVNRGYILRGLGAQLREHVLSIKRSLERQCGSAEPQPGTETPDEPTEKSNTRTPGAADSVDSSAAIQERTPLPPDASFVDCAHSPDFRSVRWFGVNYSFTPNQAACVNVLWSARQNGASDVGGETLLQAADASTQRVDVVFRNHPAWGEMIVQGGTKGSYRLAEPIDESAKRPKRKVKKTSPRARK